MSIKNTEDLTILGEVIKLGESKEISFNIAKLHTRTPIDVPVIIERSKKPGPTFLLTSGIHGDEINGVEILRQIISSGINKAKIGTIICIPVVNIFGFLNMARAFPDGRDLNRVFPGSKSGSLASRVAYTITTEILPHIDYVLDFHTGGAMRYNAPQVRITKGNTAFDTDAKVFGAPFVIYSDNIGKSFRNTCNKMGKPILLFEGGKSVHIDSIITETGVNGAIRVLDHYGMLRSNFEVPKAKVKPVFIAKSRWIRANYSGMFKASIEINSKVDKGDFIGNITDPYGKFNHFVKASNSGYIINVNESPIVYQGDALFHISTVLVDD
ncbi:MAG: succinylglutamate desuccinylase/aspartoacylase family protein [Lacinutrix sp.]|uniref:succinylglutamate desuccinylase/aspartoacylase family protein n=1 Tax=Lacinutrix sp. TaxID=1937692 RepID=UPI0030AE0066